MMWKISFSKRAEKFLKGGELSKEEVFGLLGKSVHKLQGEEVNIDIKALKGKWRGFYRIRKGEMRIIASFNFGSYSISVEAIDWRGGVYK